MLRVISDVAEDGFEQAIQLALQERFEWRPGRVLAHLQDSRISKVDVADPQDRFLKKRPWLQSQGSVFKGPGKTAVSRMRARDAAVSSKATSRAPTRSVERLSQERPGDDDNPEHSPPPGGSAIGPGARQPMEEIQIDTAITASEVRSREGGYAMDPEYRAGNAGSTGKWGIFPSGATPGVVRVYPNKAQLGRYRTSSAPQLGLRGVGSICTAEAGCVQESSRRLHRGS